MLIWSDPLVVRSDMKNLAFDYLEKYDGKKMKDIRTQINPMWSVTVIFKNLKDKEFGLMRKDNLIKIREIEKMVN